MAGDSIDATPEAFASTWENLAYPAEEHACAPIVRKWAGNHAPQTERRALAALSLRHRKASEARTIALTQILRTFRDNDIPLVILKGAALAELIYARPELRPMRDVDIMVGRDHLDIAARCLKDIGYTFDNEHLSRYMGEHHHLPNAATMVNGMKISVEIHHDAIAPDVPDSITLDNLTDPPRAFSLSDDEQAQALGHIDMLRHLSRHGFEPAQEIRLIHMFDLVAYANHFANEIDWQTLHARFPRVICALRCGHCLLPLPEKLAGIIGVPKNRPASIGLGMKPLSAIFRENLQILQIWDDLFNPPAWWLHAYYGVDPDRSLVSVRLVRHPLNVARWLVRRARTGLLSKA